jgi:hypothetical protein
MVPTTRDRTDELQALEELWAAPALGEKPVRRAWLPWVPGALLAGAWLVFYAVVLAFEPRPEPGMTSPVWATTLSAVMLLLLVAAVSVGPVFSKLGFGFATLAGPLGIVLAVNCRASGHHLGSWWLVELGATLALTGLAAVGLSQRLRT